MDLLGSRTKNSTAVPGKRIIIRTKNWTAVPGKRIIISWVILQTQLQPRRTHLKKPKISIPGSCANVMLGPMGRGEVCFPKLKMRFCSLWCEGFAPHIAKCVFAICGAKASHHRLQNAKVVAHEQNMTKSFLEVVASSRNEQSFLEVDRHNPSTIHGVRRGGGPP